MRGLIWPCSHNHFEVSGDFADDSDDLQHPNSPDENDNSSYSSIGIRGYSHSFEGITATRMADANLRFDKYSRLFGSEVAARFWQLE